MGGLAPEPFLAGLDDRLPRSGRALDVAGGDGRNGVWLAGRGLDVTLGDISAEALRLAEANAGSSQVSITTLAVDFDSDPFPPGPWDLIVCIRYLHRPLFRQFADQLRPEGLLVVVHPTIRNLERFERPGAHHLLGDGEILELLDGWTILRYQEGWRAGASGRHEARCLAGKSATIH